MARLQDYLYIQTSDDRMSASFHCTDMIEEMDMELDESDIIQYITENKIVSGIDHDAVRLIVSNVKKENFPLVIAKGQPAEHGMDAAISYELTITSEIVKTPDWNFRDVMQIPSVRKGQKLATITLQTDGKNGEDVFGNSIRAHPGKPIRIKAGKNVLYHEEKQAFFAATDGQVSIINQRIEVHKVFEVNESLSMKNGNLDFVGSITIHGDVPSGYTVQAKGDVKIFGMVEAATINAGGSIYISEGLAGLQKGYIKAEDNIHIGYINQGIAHAGNSIYVESSILHSECIAQKHVYCQQGNIIGGVLSAGVAVEAKDIGNRMSTYTEIVFGLNKALDEKEKKLIVKKQELQATLEKLTIIGQKLEAEKDQQNPKTRITKLRQRNSYHKTNDQLKEVNGMLEQINAHIGSEKEAQLIIRGQLYPNVMVAFGKYRRKIDSEHKNVHMRLVRNEITVHSLR